MKLEIPNVRVRVQRANTSEDTVMDEVFVTGTNPHQNHVLHLQGELAGVLESGTYTLQFIKDEPEVNVAVNVNVTDSKTLKNDIISESQTSLEV